ncbi:MAG: DegT/DnrJ/EryC1/StrS family aminotransferase [Bacilli bacterium]|nr:DegT/DnrJ/EryC1/StrS family aminotransferase [Bacilli bacterium]
MTKINVTKPYLPPIDEYIAKISKIWDNHILTNYGPLNNEFVEELKKYLQVDNLHYVTNGTIALQLAIDSLKIKSGEIITTPFTFVATISSIVWQNYKPVFVDIEPNTFNIDPNKIEEKITEKTSAILAVHCFGFPCDVLNLELISKKYNIPIIYDAAHCFGINYNNQSLLKYGDISICSLHATKLFHSIEGGICVVNNLEYNDSINAKKKFGLLNNNYEYVGINAKASEFNAAMGLCVLDHFNDIISYRKNISLLYKKLLSDKIYISSVSNNCEYNYIYFPILLENEDQVNNVIFELNKENIYPRRYFYPCINEMLPYIDNSKTSIASDISSRILCLPLDTYITEFEVEKICIIINNVVNKKDKCISLKK